MGTIDQSRVTSGFDVEALLGAPYLRMVLQTAYDAGVIPAAAVFGGTRLELAMLNAGRTYEPGPDANGNLPPTHPDAFETDILFNHPLGANLRVRAQVQPENNLPFFFDLFVRLDLEKTHEEGSISSAGLTITVVDIESPALVILAEPPFNMPKSEVLAKVKAFVDRKLDIGGTSKFKKVEDIAIRWHEGDDEHAPALGIYINIRMRNGDEEDQFLPPRGDLDQAANFLPADEDIAFASRPGLYGDMSKDVFSRTAIKDRFGNIEHALRYNILNPNSTRIGTIDSIRVGQIVTLPSPSVPPMGLNGLRIALEGEYVDPIDLTNTDVTFTIDIKPSIDSDGFLVWSTDLDVDVDALFEFITFWAVTLTFILFGPIGAGIFLGVVLVAEVGAGIFFGEYFEARAAKKADATLSDVIPDRLTIKTRRWDPFYATLHQVVTKPSQAQFNAKGFMLCGKAVVGRALVPPVDTVIRDEIRDADGTITALRYRLADFEKIQEDTALQAVGTHRRAFTPADPAEPDLFALTLDQIQARMDDPDGPLVITDIPYFPAYAYVRDNQIDQLLCLSGAELQDVRDRLRDEKANELFAEVVANEGDAIRQQVVDDLSAGGGTPTPEAIEAEFQVRVRKKVKALMSEYESPTPIEMAHAGILAPLLRFDAAPEELLMLQQKRIIAVDSALASIEPRAMQKYLRDKARSGEEHAKDNLLERPRYRPGPDGPQFP
ncbi:MAG TPA: hypothetical protein VFZ66_02640 [Herpetosiphonaceae bacterium]